MDFARWSKPNRCGGGTDSKERKKGPHPPRCLNPGFAAGGGPFFCLSTLCISVHLSVTHKNGSHRIEHGISNQTSGTHVTYHESRSGFVFPPRPRADGLRPRVTSPRSGWCPATVPCAPLLGFARKLSPHGPIRLDAASRMVCVCVCVFGYLLSGLIPLCATGVGPQLLCHGPDACCFASTGR